MKTDPGYPRCKTCKWWGDGDDSDSWRRVRIDAETNLATSNLCSNTENVASAPKVQDRHGMGDATAWVFEDDRALSLDGSGYFAALETGPEFGCVHHKQRES